MSNTLNISESFYSIQCEGRSTGYPAYFIRLKGCNLSCGLSTKHLSQIQKAGKGQTIPADYKGDLHVEGKATWTCDTAPVWLFGEKTTHNQLIDKWKEEDVYEWITAGRIHLIWTGGEPAIPKHQQEIIKFLEYLDLQEEYTNIYNELETNGTFELLPEFSKQIHQINCSVKLKNSGMSVEQRIKPEALASIMAHDNYWFKFVISNESDLEEVIEDFVFPFGIPAERIIIMPGLDNQEDFHERTRFILETAKKYGYIGLTRLHVSAWNKTTGV